jgi:hypothetical protein
LTLLLLRAAVVSVMLTAPFVLAALSYGKAEGMIWLMFPVVLFIPVVLGSVLLLAPLEALVTKVGLNPNIALPIFGALVGVVVVAVALSNSKNPKVMSQLLAGEPTMVGAAAGIILLGAVVGGAWRLSLWVVKSLNWA